MNTLTRNIFPYAVGFETLINDLETFSSSMQNVAKYPPHDLVKVDENHYYIELAVAGFGEEDITVNLEKDTLTVSGERDKSEEGEIVHRGISKKSFTKSFKIAKDVEVESASLVHGLLRVDLRKVVPEDEKPRNIPVTGSRQLLEG